MTDQKLTQLMEKLQGERRERVTVMEVMEHESDTLLDKLFWNTFALFLRSTSTLRCVVSPHLTLFWHEESSKRPPGS
jgi:hypothetical protein